MSTWAHRRARPVSADTPFAHAVDPPAAPMAPQPHMPDPYASALAVGLRRRRTASTSRPCYARDECSDGPATSLGLGAAPDPHAPADMARNAPQPYAPAGPAGPLEALGPLEPYAHAPAHAPALTPAIPYASPPRPAGRHGLYDPYAPDAGVYGEYGGYDPTLPTDGGEWPRRLAAPFVAGGRWMRHAAAGRHARGHAGAAGALAAVVPPRVRRPVPPAPVTVPAAQTPCVFPAYAQHTLAVMLELVVQRGLSSKIVAVDRATGAPVFAWRRVQGVWGKVYDLEDVRIGEAVVRLRHDLLAHVWAGEDAATSGPRFALRRRRHLSALGFGNELAIDCALAIPAAGSMVCRLPVVHRTHAHTYEILHPAGTVLTTIQIEWIFSRMSLHLWSVYRNSFPTIIFLCSVWIPHSSLTETSALLRKSRPVSTLSSPWPQRACSPRRRARYAALRSTRAPTSPCLTCLITPSATTGMPGALGVDPCVLAERH